MGRRGLLEGRLIVTKEKEEERGRLRRTFDSTRQRIGETTERATGAQFRKRFEEFTEAVTSVVLGIHRDQAELKDRLTSLEDPQQRSVTPSGGMGMVIWALGVSFVALTLGIVAVILAVL